MALKFTKEDEERLRELIPLEGFVRIEPLDAAPSDCRRQARN